MLDLDALDFEKGGGVVTVVTIDATNGALLMIAHADRSALERTLATGEMHYHSRSRGPWHKGGTSGNVQRVASLAADCDGDAVLARVRAAGPACHAGTMSCFRGAGLEGDVLSRLDATIAGRAAAAVRSSESAMAALPPADASRAAGTRSGYTQRLLADRNLRLKKLGEEATELALACADGDPARAAEEGADVVYHLLVALRAVGVSLDDVRRVLAARAGER